MFIDFFYVVFASRIANQTVNNDWRTEEEVLAGISRYLLATTEAQKHWPLPLQAKSSQMIAESGSVYRTVCSKYLNNAPFFPCTGTFKQGLHQGE